MRVLYITFFIVLADQITKLLVKGFTFPVINYYHQGMHLGQSIPVVGDIIRITFIENPGMVFGLEVGGQFLRSVFTLAACLAILYYIYHVRNEHLTVRLTLAMILGGAIGNLIDRIFYGVIFGEAPLFYGKVVDFIDVDIPDINFLGIQMERFAIFNIADSAVTVGIVLMLLFHKKFTKEDKTAVTEPAGNETTPQNDLIAEKVQQNNNLTDSSELPS